MRLQAYRKARNLTCRAEQRAQQALILCNQLGQLLNQAAQCLAGGQGVPRAYIRFALCLSGLCGRLPNHIQDQFPQVVRLLQIGHQAPIDGLGLLREGFGELSAKHALCMPSEDIVLPGGTTPLTTLKALPLYRQHG